MTASNDVLVSDGLLEDKCVTIFCRLYVFVRCPVGRFSKQIFATTGHGSHRGAAGTDIYFENVTQVAIFIPRLSVRHVSDGITGIENILLMSVVLYISIDNTGTNVHICINYVN